MSAVDRLFNAEVRRTYAADRPPVDHGMIGSIHVNTDGYGYGMRVPTPRNQMTLPVSVPQYRHVPDTPDFVSRRHPRRQIAIGETGDMRATLNARMLTSGEVGSYRLGIEPEYLRLAKASLITNRDAPNQSSLQKNTPKLGRFQETERQRELIRAENKVYGRTSLPDGSPVRSSTTSIQHVFNSESALSPVPSGAPRSRDNIFHSNVDFKASVSMRPTRVGREGPSMSSILAGGDSTPSTASTSRRSDASYSSRANPFLSTQTTNVSQLPPAGLSKTKSRFTADGSAIVRNSPLNTSLELTSSPRDLMFAATTNAHGAQKAIGWTNGLRK